MIGVLLLACMAGDPVSVAVESDRTEYYLGESIPVRIRIEVDASSLVPLTLRRTDVPVLLEAPWLKGLAAGPGDATLAVNDDVVAARRTAGTAGTTVLLIERTLRPEKAGDLELAAPVVRFASATRFDTDALGTHIALDRTEGSVRGNALAIRVLPLPVEGRPEGFSGGVGRFTITAAADAQEVEWGKSLTVVVTIEGTGDLSAISPPRLDGSAYHVLGRLDGGDGRRRTFTYEITPTRGKSSAVSAIPLYFFDPGPPAGYRVEWTQPLRFNVLRAPEEPPPPGKGRRRSTSLVVVLLIGTIAILLIRRKKALPGP